MPSKSAADMRITLDQHSSKKLAPLRCCWPPREERMEKNRLEERAHMILSAITHGVGFQLRTKRQVLRRYSQ